MAGRKKWDEIRRSNPDDPVFQERYAEFSRAADAVVALADLRAARGVSQVELSAAMGIRQPSLSQLEHREDMFLSTLRAYVAALGGTLEVRALFPDGAVVLFVNEADDTHDHASAGASAAGAIRRSPGSES